MATSQRGFQLGILPERKIDRRALVTSYTLMVLLTLLLINIGVLFPDRLQLKPYHVTELIPLPSLRPEPAPVEVKAHHQAQAAAARAGFRTAQAGRTA